MNIVETIEFDAVVMPKNKKRRVSKSKAFLLFSLIFLILTVVLSPKITKEMDLTLYPIKYSEYVEKYSSLNNLPKTFVYALILSESSFQPDAVSEVNAIGLMQITEETFEWIKFKMNDENENNTSFTDLFNPETNIKYGTFLLRLHLDEFKSEKNVLAAYHAGRGQLKAWLSDNAYSKDGLNLDEIPSKKTNHYVHKVLKSKEKYQELYFD